MKSQLFLFSFLLMMIGACQTAPSDNTLLSKDMESLEESNEYDSLLASELGADQYGMKSYVFAFLKAGPNRGQDSLESANLMKAHLDNIGRLADEGKLALAGPFMDDGEIRGIYIFNTSSIDEARDWTNSDPAIQAGRLVMDLKPWFGSAALGKVNELHKRIQKTEI